MILILRILRELTRRNALHILDGLSVPSWITWLCSIVWKKSEQKSSHPVVDTCIALGPSFVKFGQALSIRPDLVGPDIAAELRQLQDSMPGFSKELVRKTIEETLKSPIDRQFSHFEDEAVAAASIAQVHRARTLQGEDVAVKVIRPGIGKLLNGDIRRLRSVAKQILLMRPAIGYVRPLDAIDQFAKWSHKELDLRLEAANCVELSRRFRDTPWFQPPKVYWDQTGKDCLTEEWIDGVRLDDHKSIRALGLDPSEILRQSIEAFFKQVFEHGFFHGDIHPGNIFVTKEGVLRPIDFGIMGRIPLETRHHLADMLSGFMVGDYELVTDSLMGIGFFSDTKSKPDLANSLRIIVEPLLKRSPSGVSFARILAEVITLARTFDLKYSPDLMLLNKGMFQAEGTGRLIDPTLNVWVATEDHMERWLIKHRGPTAQIKRKLSTINTIMAGLEKAYTRDNNDFKQLDSVRRLILIFLIGIFTGIVLLVATLWLYGFAKGI